MTDNRSNLCKILGVDYDEVFEFRGNKYKLTKGKDFYGVNYPHQNQEIVLWENMRRDWLLVSSVDLSLLINYPDEIIRHKTFTQEEIDDAKVLHRLWNFEKIARFEYGLYATDYDGEEITINYTQFPSIKNGESYTYEQIIGGNY